MTLRQMEYLVTVTEQQSFTRAAETLNVTQSALSHQIKALEGELGGPLLERLPRGVRLTAMGRAFLPGAELAVRSARQARRAARAATGARGGELQIATLHGLAIGVLPPVLARMRRLCPEVRLVLHEFATDEQLTEQMERGVADVAVGYRTDGWSGPLWTVGEERIVLVVPRGDPLHGRASARLEELAEHDWVRCGMEPWVEGERFLDLVCGRAGFRPRTAVWTEHSTTAARAAAEGAGVAMLAAHLVPSLVPADQLLAVDPPWQRPIRAFCRTEPAGAADVLLRTLNGALPGQRLSAS
ncbi:LysR family transcriptional regulator [Streptomyces sp. HNM0574]|uniref:LysR substrate-binding domain-containing protein n=1 Tax=Streptomyces sp. HNM0574 TaxID=2714954 RepID=UPI001469F907|nr:LysR family transcriptional regulator [Streptomyces sp. HNM0574]NLU65849.1 LysR family transcriptional regulator [Streptomyces sp. HNM0574]